MKAITNVLIILLLACPIMLQAQTLEDYLKEAADHNPGLQAKYREFEAAIEKVQQVSSLPDPGFSFGYFISPVETRVGPQRARLSLSQMFPWFGTLKAQGNAAALMAEAKYQAFMDARNELYYKIAAAYYPLYELKETLRLQRKNLEILESYIIIASKKFENGQGTMVDVLRVDIMIKDARTNINILEDKKKPLLTVFNKLLDRNENEEVVVNDVLSIDSLQLGYRRDSLLASHPQLESLRLKGEAMVEQEQAAIKQGLPRFGVGLDYVVVGERTDVSAEAGMSIPDNGKNAFMPMVTMSIPLFRGKYKAAEREAQLMQEVYAKMSEETENSLLSSYENAWFGIEKNRQYLELYEAQILETEQALNLLFSAYANAGKDFEEVLRMQQQLLKYEMLQATAITEYKVAEAKLNYLTAKNY